LTTEDALELLAFQPQHAPFRNIAIKVLEKRPLDEVLLFLPQLIQLVYHFGQDESLATLLLQLAAKSSLVYNQFSWMLLVQQQVKPSTHLEALHERLIKVNESDLIRFNRQRKLVTNFNNMSKYMKKHLHNIPRPDRIKQMRTIIEGTHNYAQHLSMMNLEQGTVQTHHSIQDIVCKQYHWELIFPIHVPLPSYHELVVTGINTEKCYIFKSAMAPMTIPLVIDEKNTVSIIFKRGDDLRQDALIMQLLQFMDEILKLKGLDMCLSPFDILACGIDHGIVELVPNSQTIASILETHSSIYDYLASKNDTYESLERALRTFTKSCAAYCVITFLLGIGDRHLDNSKSIVLLFLKYQFYCNKMENYSTSILVSF
jgi:phosphatidylinositol 3-kinase